MKGLLKNKFLIGLVVVVVIVVVLALMGVLRFNFTVSKTGEESSPRSGGTGQEVTESGGGGGLMQSQQLMSRETDFKAADEALTMAIKLPVGWSLGSSEEVDFVAGSQIPERLVSGVAFTVNLNASAARHPAEVSSFADYESQWKAEMLAGNPSLEEVTGYSKKVGGLDVYILEVLNTRPDGLVVHQVQYVYYLNDTYFLVATASAPNELWDKYSGVLMDSLESIRLVEAMESSEAN